MLVDGTGTLWNFLRSSCCQTGRLWASRLEDPSKRLDGMEPVLCCPKSSRSPFVTTVAAGLAVARNLAFPTGFIVEKHSASYS
ncbi:hypothetical protein BDW71DRAFT_174830 [Aspergillus fruticulosus]